MQSDVPISFESDETLRKPQTCAAAWCQKRIQAGRRVVALTTLTRADGSTPQKGDDLLELKNVLTFWHTDCRERQLRKEKRHAKA